MSTRPYRFKQRQSCVNALLKISEIMRIVWYKNDFNFLLTWKWLSILLITKNGFLRCSPKFFERKFNSWAAIKRDPVWLFLFKSEIWCTAELRLIPATVPGIYQWTWKIQWIKWNYSLDWCNFFRLRLQQNLKFLSLLCQGKPFFDTWFFFKHFFR